MNINPLQRHQKLQSTKPEERQTPYQRLYGLKENPFPAMALFTPSMDDPRRNGKIYDEQFRMAEERLFFELFIQPPSGDKPLDLGFVRLDPQAGGRGNGKSTFLNHLMNRINGQKWEDWVTDENNQPPFSLAVHLLPEPRRQKRFWQFVRLIFETLSDKNLYQKVDADLRAAMLLKLLSEDQINQLAQLPAEQVAPILQSQDAFVSKLKDYGHTVQAYSEEVERQLRLVASGAMNQDFMTLFLSKGAQLSELWSTWEKDGTSRSDYRWRNNGADWLLNGLIPVLIVAGYQHLYILLDEFEKIYIYQSSREREEFLDALRQYFYERESVAVRRQYISVVLTVHPSIDRYLKNSWARVGLDNLAPLDHRMQHQSVELGASNPSNLSHLLMTYLDYFRIDETQKGKLSLYPFEENALEPAMDAARFYPRGALWFAYTILQKAATEDVAVPITRKFVEEFVASGLKPPVEEEDNLFQLPSLEGNLQA